MPGQSRPRERSSGRLAGPSGIPSSSRRGTAYFEPDEPRAGIAVGAVTVAVGLLICGGVAAFPPTPSGPVPFSAAISAAGFETAFLPGAPWYFTTAVAYEFDAPTPYSFNQLLRDSIVCPAVGSAFTEFPSGLSEIPAQPGSPPADVAPFWVLTFGNVSGALLEVAVVDGAAVPFAESAGGAPCLDYTFLHYPALPTAAILQSSTAIDDLDEAGTTDCSECSIATGSGASASATNATFELAYRGGWGWTAWIGQCDPFDAVPLISGPSVGDCFGWQGWISAINPEWGWPPAAWGVGVFPPVPR